jgi:hypothetical protein
VLNSKDILYSKGNNDECYTPEYAVLPILEFTEQFKNKIIWCPFDTEESNFVKILKNNGFHVVYSHIRDNQNFYNYQPEQWDVIISNPPFSNKKEIFERALSFDKPFALLMTLTWLNDSGPKKIFYEKDLQLLMFDKRILFDNNNKITFSSAYYCYNFLPKQIIMRNLIKTKTYNKEPQLLL